MSNNACNIRYNDTVARQMFALLRGGLWNQSVDSSLFEGKVDWEKLMNLADEQCVTAIVFDGIKHLPKAFHPEMDMFMDWLGQSSRIEELNKSLNRGIVEVVGRYNKSGLKPILLKGQGISQYFSNPLHRNSGDIDLFFPEGIEEANKLASTWDGVKFQEATKHHQGLTWKGHIIENHNSYFDFYHPKNQKNWEKVKDMIPLTDGEMLRLEDFDVPVPSPQMNALYIFLHLWHHFQQKGIAIRHVCDWICLWQACGDKIDKGLFLKVVDILPLKRPMTAIAWIGENYLGLSTGVIPLDTTTRQAKKDGKMMLADILKMGNFGRSTDMMKGFKRGHHLNNLRSYYIAGKRQMRLFRLCPSEIMAYPVSWLKQNI